MRSDYLLYMLAVLFFVAAGVSLSFFMELPEKILWVIINVVLGLVVAGFGYYYRPRIKTLTIKTPRIEETDMADAHVREAHLAETVETHAEPTVTPQTVTTAPGQLITPIPAMTPAPVEAPAPLESELMEVKGIGGKRAAQLKAQGVNTVDDLARASPEDLAKNLAISPKITQKWVDGAKELQKQTS